ncbi:hypothetical protein FIBSPDRAFT_1038524 [Athelia psychrophila]|uniref:Uncharacterized protein n=1 Tax=Athelia psychrophila TaxID=1759441 RepID=A0A166T528_9AGAM|nr:hypothetical protein FIBSPDRAFT_1038524 [Fibularhizoctonia sp. CBS 109695]
MLPKAVLHHLFLAISLAITSLWATNPGNNIAFSRKILEAQTLVFGFGEVVAARVAGALSALAIKDIQHDVLQFAYVSAGMGSGEAGEEFDGGEFEGRQFYGGDRQIPAYKYEFEDDGSAFPINDDPAARFDERESEELTRGEIIFVFRAIIGLCAIFRSIIRRLARRFITAADAPEDPDPDPSEPPDGSIEAAQGQELTAASDADVVMCWAGPKAQGPAQEVGFEYNIADTSFNCDAQHVYVLNRVHMYAHAFRIPIDRLQLAHELLHQIFPAYITSWDTSNGAAAGMGIARSDSDG